MAEEGEGRGTKELEATRMADAFGTVTQERSNEMHAVAGAAAAKAEIEAAYVMAERHPRNVEDVRVQIVALCKNPTFAKKARYKKPLGGGKEAVGPSIRMAEALSQLWGNLFNYKRIIYEDMRKRVVLLVCRDLERNSSFMEEITVEKTVERKAPRQGQEIISWRTNSYGDRVALVVASEDEMFTKENAWSSKIIRNLILRQIPEHIKEEAMVTCRLVTTDEKAKDPDTARKELVDRFALKGILPSDLEGFLGHASAQITPAIMADLEEMITSIEDGHATWADYLKEKDSSDAPSGQPDPATAAAKHAGIAETLKREKIAKPVQAQEAPAAKPPVDAQQPAPAQRPQPTPAQEPEKSNNPTDGELLVPMRLIQQMENGQSIIRKLVLKYAAATPDGAEWPADPEVRLAYLDELWKATNETKKPIFQPVKPVAKPAESQPVVTPPSVSAPPEPPVPSDQMLQFDVHVKAIKEALDFEAVMKARMVAGETKSYSMLQQDELDRAMNERLGELRKAKAVKKA